MFGGAWGKSYTHIVLYCEREREIHDKESFGSLIATLLGGMGPEGEGIDEIDVGPVIIKKEENPK